LDCTNIITPVLSIITNISYDHTQLLGNTLTAIAKEKAGIIKPGVPVVIGEAEGEVRAFFRAKCHPALDAGSPIICHGMADQVRHDNSEMIFAQDQTPDYPELICELSGLAQEKNTATVLCAINLLKEDVFSIPDEAVYRGFRHVIKNTGLQGRWQIVGKKPKIVLDTGHNEAGIKYIVQQLQSEKFDRLHIVFGMVNDKDISAILALLPLNAIYYFTRASNPRALDAGLLAGQAEKLGLQGRVFSSVTDALLAAKHRATEKDFIFVGGSTFVVADALKVLSYKL
jgi:dihydrofolate synthase/folylpolyglutamate synthase